MPTLSALTGSLVAEPALRVIGLPSVAVPSLKVSVPVGLLPFTVAVNWTACPKTLGEVAANVVVVAARTVTVGWLVMGVSVPPDPLLCTVNVLTPGVVGA